MTSQRKLERDHRHAEMAGVNKLLGQLDAGDVMARFGLEARREELRELIAEAETEKEEMAASAILYFAGRPVTGTRGIESEFAGAAVSKFQDLVAKVTAQEAGTLGQRGVVPNKGLSTLHITNITRGSVGFVLEEVQPSAQPFDTPLKNAVSEAMLLLDTFGEPDEAQFQNAIEAIDQRVFGAARDFFRLPCANAGRRCDSSRTSRNVASMLRPSRGRPSERHPRPPKMPRSLLEDNWLACYLPRIDSSLGPMMPIL